MSRTIYQAGPLFSEAERDWHRALAARLRAIGHKVIWPGDLLGPEHIQDAGPAAPDLIFRSCLEALRRCDCVIALLDGPQVDDGTAFELGYAHALGLPVYGLRTDSRQAGDTPHNRMNSMVEGCLRALAGSTDELLALLA